MYYPHQCGLYVATDGRQGFDFDALMAKIDAIPAPAAEGDWIGESVLNHDVFVSPAARTLEGHGNADRDRHDDPV